ncbi:MAG TPA: FlgD immunoglobulin-like domain containing protein [Flavobacteriales bacterium]|nr:FlgD immunoglobulin-like domain containing protein [Flavobacteriales bacterium]
MTKPLAFIAAFFLGALAAQAQFVTYRFTDGSVIIHQVTDIRSTDFDGGNMRVFLWDGTMYEWSLTSLANYRFTDISTAAPEQGENLVPVLVYPNPASDEVWVTMITNGTGRTVVEVLDLRGGIVRTLLDGALTKGDHRLLWDSRNAHGDRVADGTYLIRVIHGPRIATHQLILQQ